MSKYFFEPRLIKEIRTEKKIPIKEIKAKAGLCSKAQLNQWENGERTPSAKKIAALASVLGVPPCSFFLKEHTCKCECGE